jgi:hypothetical protein
MFDLDMQIANWREQMEAVEGILPENLDEMEDHLRLQVEALEEAGLSGEEALWVGRHRLGEAQTLAEEFRKVNGGPLLLTRLRWMIFGYLALELLVSLGFFLAYVLGQVSLVYAQSPEIAGIVYILLSACIPVSIWLGLRQVLRAAGSRQLFLRQRRLWLGVVVVALVLLPVLQLASTYLLPQLLSMQLVGQFYKTLSITSLVTSIGMPLFLAGLLAWLEARRKVKPLDVA